MRASLVIATLLLAGCGPRFVRDTSSQMSPKEMPGRADHVFIGVIDKHEFQLWPFYRVPYITSPDWRLMRMKVRIENVLAGSEPRKSVDVYEFIWTGATTGDWNSTQNGSRYLFFVRVENGRYHVVRDWWRCIFRISSGAHSRLPLDESRPFWERAALLMWWVQPGWDAGLGNLSRQDPGNALRRWREVKILRGLLRHPDHELRLLACSALLAHETGQDECWEQLTPAEKIQLKWEFESARGRKRLLEAHSASELWDTYLGWHGDHFRLLTTESNARLRADSCRLFKSHFPDDRDNGCYAEQPPATIVTEAGDVPLTGPWPSR